MAAELKWMGRSEDGVRWWASKGGRLVYCVADILRKPDVRETLAAMHRVFVKSQNRRPHA